MNPRFATDPPLNLEELLDGIPLPAGKVEIISYAQDRGAGEDALNILQGLPENTYKTFEAINKDLGLIEDLPGSENMWSSNSSADNNV